MSSKEDILGNVRKHIKVQYDMPDMDIQVIEYLDKIARFIEASKTVGGNAILLGKEEDINTVIRSLYPESQTIASNLEDITITTLNPDEVENPANLNGTDLAIVKGEIGVAENGCVWIPQSVKEKALYFIAEYLVIILDKEKVVNNMHEAYERITFNDYGFGTFISGPSKTADIEQALIVGAHGARGVTVILK
ncbi:MAG: LUD domain-containing protein [Prevotella sp.]|jgi:L-lactate dehydrogenase complex protein LldG|nr:LUD domain-containing protein [Prevotella sp.]